MRIRLLISAMAIFAFMLTAVIGQRAVAVDVLQGGCDGGANTKFCQDVNASKSTDKIMGPNGILTKIGQIIVYFTGAISVIMVIIGGFRYVISGGDSSGVQSAKNTILYALVGLVVALSAQVIVSFVLSRL